MCVQLDQEVAGYKEVVVYIFYGHSLLYADSRRAVVSFWHKNVQILVVRLED